jgi:hypothetical protein
LSIEFPDGSTNAAIALLSAFNMLEEKPECKIVCQAEDRMIYEVAANKLFVDQYTDDTRFLSLLIEEA